MTPASSRPSTDLASTSVRPCSRPSSRRCEEVRDADRRRGAARRGRRRRRSSTSKPRASSANGSRVQPVTRSKRAWCQWQVTRPALDRALVEREAHVGAAVLDRAGAVLAPEHDDRQGADLGQQPTGGLQLRERPGTGGHEFEGMSWRRGQNCPSFAPSRVKFRGTRKHASVGFLNRGSTRTL